MPKLSEVSAPAAAALPRRKLSEVSGTRPPSMAAQNPSDPYEQYVKDRANAPPPPDPDLFRFSSDFQDRGNVSGASMLWGAAKDMFGSREGAAAYLADKAGGTVGQDEDGSPLVALRDGTRYRLNEQGLDLGDVSNVTGNVAAFFGPAGWVSKLNQAKNFGLGTRMLTQAGTGVATDATAQAIVNGGQVDPTRAVLSGLGGGAGEFVGSGLARVFSGVRARVAQDGARKTAERLAQESGATLTPEQMAQLTRGVSEIGAGADPRAVLGREEFGFLYTQGQRLAEGHPQKFGVLSREEVLRQAPGSADVFSRASAHNTGKLGTALDRLAGRTGAPAAASPSELISGVAAKVRGQADDLRGQIDSAYTAAGKSERTAIGREAVAALPDRLKGALREFDVNPKTMPGTARALNQVRNAAKVILASPEGSSVSGVTLRAIETQRRIINNAIGTAANPTDRRALTMLKAEYDRWLDDAVETALVSGDPDALALLKNARGLRAEYGRRFEGGTDTDRFVTGLVDGSRTPEELLNMAMGAAQVSKASGARFIERLRVATNNDPQVMAALRAANLMRLTRGANGEALSMGQIVRNVDSAEFSNGSMMRALYSPQEWQEIRRLAGALQPLLARGDMARTSGTAERLARMFFQRMGGGGLPVLGPIADAVSAGRNWAQAGRAINDPLRVPLRAPAGAQAILAGVADEYFGR